jgi:uncharacterized protein (DUF58 family)
VTRQATALRETILPAPAVLDRLARFSLVTARAGQLPGERTSREGGRSAEFLDHRPYQLGDDLRYVDWAAYARSDKLYTKVYAAERDARVLIALDTSASMGVGGKLGWARRVAAALCYVAYRRETTLLATSAGAVGVPARGAAALRRAWNALDGVNAGGDVSPSGWVAGLAATAKGGLCVAITDAFDPDSLRNAVRALRARRMDAVLIHVLAPEDLNPPAGAWEAVDAETASRTHVGADTIIAYKREVRRFVEGVSVQIRRAGFRYVRALTTTDPEPFVLHVLRREGVLA